MTTNRGTDVLLEVSDLSTTVSTARGTLHAVNNVSLRIRRGEAVALVGESGSGKTTTALSIAQLLPPAAQVVQGRITLNGRDLRQLPESELREVRGNELGMTFQDPITFLNPIMTVGQQLVESLRAHRRLGKEEAERQAVGMLELVQMPDPRRRMRAHPHQLSGGQRQRALLAIAIAGKPSLLIADEPTTALDVTVQAAIMRLLAGIRTSTGSSLLLITHDLGLVAEYCDRVYIMYAGSVVEEADVADFFRGPRHPYARLLLANTLSVEQRVEDFVPISGRPPDLISPPEGCVFHPRCPESLSQCSRQPPPWVTHGPTARSSCWLPAEDRR